MAYVQCEATNFREIRIGMHGSQTNLKLFLTLAASMIREKIYDRIELG